MFNTNNKNREVKDKISTAKNSKFKTLNFESNCSDRSIQNVNLNNLNNNPVGSVKRNVSNLEKKDEGIKLNLFKIPTDQCLNSKEVKEYYKKFKISGTGTVVAKKGCCFKKTSGKGINSCVFFPKLFNSGCNFFKIRITSENTCGISVVFEKPSGSSFVCKTRLLQNGIGISADGKCIGLETPLQKEFFLKNGDDVACLLDYAQGVICMSVNGTNVIESNNHSQQLMF